MINISATDKKHDEKLYQEGSQVKMVFQEYLKISNDFGAIKNRNKKAYKSGEKPSNQNKLSQKKLQLEYENIYFKLDNMITKWNNEMNILIKKYNYLKLGEFLARYDYLENWEARPSKEIAVATVRFAKAKKVYRLFSLDFGTERMSWINYYPENWLSENFDEIYSYVKSKY